MEEKLNKTQLLSFNVKRIIELLEPEIDVTIKCINLITENNVNTVQIEYIDGTFKHLKENQLAKYILELENI